MKFTVIVQQRLRTQVANERVAWVRERDFPDALPQTGDHLVVMRNDRPSVVLEGTIWRATTWTDAEPMGAGRRKGDRYLKLEVA